MVGRIPRVAFLAPALAVAFAASVACGGGDSGSTGAATPAPTKAAATAAAVGSATSAGSPAAAATPTKAAATTAAASATGAQKITGAPPAGSAVVDQKDQLFKPDKVTAKLGDAVYFTNSEAVVHSVNVDTKNLLGTGGQMKQGETLSWKPSKAGTYTITCDYHPAMKATVTVQ